MNSIRAALARRTRPRHRRGSSARDEGAVTVETAIVLPSIVLLLAVLLACGGAAMLQVRAEEAAGAAARVMARGESAADAQREAEAIAGNDAVVSVQRDDDRATAAVRLPAPGVLGRWESLEVSAEATTFSEEVIVDVG